MTAAGTTAATCWPASALPGGRQRRMTATAASTSTTSIGGDASSRLSDRAPACHSHNPHAEEMLPDIPSLETEPH